MTTKRICFTRSDGGVSIVIPSPGRVAKLMSNGLTEVDAVSVIRDEVVPRDAVNPLVCEARNIPTDRAFRDAWVQNTSSSKAAVKVDMPKARDIHRDLIRRARTQKFQELDGKWMKALAAGNNVEADRCEAERQVLRDLPQNPAIDTAKTPEELKALRSVIE